MYKLIDKDGNNIQDKQKMIDETRQFYEQLYKKRDLINKPIEGLVKSLPKLEEDEARTIEGLITLKEASSALKNMKNGKSPGTDGMTVDFFKVFWKQIGCFVVRSLNEGFNKNKMSITQREGIIICIPKGDKPRQYLKNWRPISLLNVTYKIGSSCIANRIKGLLPKLIHEDQSGFVPGRYIGDNLRLIYDMIHYLNNENLPGLLVSVDFEKAFDSIDWKFMQDVLKRFGFGDNIIQWVSSFYNDIRSSVIVNGKASQYIKIERGCRQGDPISPYLFILCAEVLACMVREDDRIRGIRISDTEFKISQFADDTTLLLEGDRESYEQLFKHLETFGNIAGLKLNHGKSNNIWLGSKRNSQIEWLPHLDMCWNPQKFKLLGLWFTPNLQKMEDLNTVDKFYETKILFKQWLKRSNTPVGRVVVLKSLILSKLIYLWIMLPNPPDQLIKNLQKRCFEFVWDEKRDKIKRKIAVRHIKEGGINIPDINLYIQALKLSWLRRLTSNPSAKWNYILRAKHPEIKNLESYGSKYLQGKIQNPFWRDVLTALDILNVKTDLNTAEDLLAEPLFWNEKFKIGGKTLYFKDWKTNNLFSVKSVIKENGSFLTLQELQRKYNFNPKPLEYMGCISTIKNYIKRQNINITSNNAQSTPKIYALIKYGPKGSRSFYDILINKTETSNACKNWEKLLGKDIDWPKIFSKANRIEETKLKWFQLKICHRILVTNCILMKMGVVQTNLCNFCEISKDSIDHYLWKCVHVQRFWKEFESWLKDKCTHCDKLSLNLAFVLFGRDEMVKTDDGFDFILIQAKYFVYKCRINKIKPKLAKFKEEFKKIYNVDKYVHAIRMSTEKCKKKWVTYENLIESNN